MRPGEKTNRGSVLNSDRKLDLIFNFRSELI